MRRRAPDPDTLLGFLMAQGFRSLVQRIEGQLDGAGSGTTVAEPVPVERDYELVTDLGRVDAWIAMANEAGTFAVDTETTGLEIESLELVGISLATAPGPPATSRSRSGRRDGPETMAVRAAPAPAGPKAEVSGGCAGCSRPGAGGYGQNIKYAPTSCPCGRHRGETGR